MARAIRAAVSVTVVAMATALLAACQATGPSNPEGKVLRVPSAYATPALALAAATRGDTVLLAAGTYDPFIVTTPGVRVRGEDRNAVIVDGRGRKSNGIVVTVSDVTLENFTVRDFLLNGVLVTGMHDDQGGVARGSDGYTRLDPAKFPPLTSFAVRSVTAYNNGLYGIYAFDAHNGVLEDTYTSGSADSGLYVGQCEGCRVAVLHNVAEFNAVGYEQANASDSVIVAGNRFSDNRVGASLLSDYQEAFVPERRTTFVGNLIADNNEAATPNQADGGFGIGLGIGGGQDNEILRNAFLGNSTAGVAVTSSADVAPKGNRFAGNLFQKNALDLGYYATSRAVGHGNCLEGNTISSALPARALAWTCPAGADAQPGVTFVPPTAPKGISFRKVAPPPPQPSRPDHGWSQPGFPTIDVGSYAIPTRTLLSDRAR